MVKIERPPLRCKDYHVGGSSRWSGCYVVKMANPRPIGQANATSVSCVQPQHTDYTGKLRYFTAQTRSEAKSEAKRLESEHRLIRQGIRPAPLSADKHRQSLFPDIAVEYLEWGEAQGGRGGRAWSARHSHKRRPHLQWWQEHLGLESLGDLYGILPRVERELRGLQRAARTGKTLANYAEAVTAFCAWCKQRG